MTMSAHETGKHKHFACGAVVPGCAFEASAATEDELMKKVKAHAAQAHGIAEVTPALAAQVKAHIRTE
jgi:predicted small metal-binding protein